MIAPTGKDPEHSDTDEDLSDDDTPMEEQERKEELDTEVRPPRVVPRSDGAATPTDGADAGAEWQCPGCQATFARNALIHGRPALKLVGGKVRMAKK